MLAGVAAGMLAICLGGFFARSAHAERAPDITLTAEIDARAHETYRLVPFDVPAGIRAITVEFDYTGRDARTTIDVGLLGPDGFSGRDGFRGWSGGNKRKFTVGNVDATPSYLPGPITAGRWNLLLGIPNIREGQTSNFAARVFFDREAMPKNDAWREPVINQSPGWYRGDLHSHSGHSDGTCTSRSGRERVPCPLFLLLDRASQRGLDFLAVTEHNTISHVRELTAQQPYFDTMLLIPGMEVTTFQGHANVFGISQPLDFRVSSTSVPDWNRLLSTVREQQWLISINHPLVPGGEVCMGCRWSPQPQADLKDVQAIEVVNGQDVETPKSGIAFWHEQLQRGLRVTGIGGSDTHDATTQSQLAGRPGVPTTVVNAQRLSTSAIVDGIRSGRVFIDTEGTAERLLDMQAESKGRTILMGEEMRLNAGQTAQVSVHVEHAQGSRIEVILDGSVLPNATRSNISAEEDLQFTITGDGRRHWLRANVRAADGRLLLIGNPIYIATTRQTGQIRSPIPANSVVVRSFAWVSQHPS